jgi:hypothetical protein
MVHERQRAFLADHIRQRMADAAQPLSELYNLARMYRVPAQLQYTELLEWIGDRRKRLRPVKAQMDFV